VPSLPAALAEEISAVAGAEAAIAAAICAAVEVAAEEPLVATFTVMSLPETETLSGVETPETTYRTRMSFPATPGVTAVWTRSLLEPASAVVSDAAAR
jgi:hypothetical protein